MTNKEKRAKFIEKQIAKKGYVTTADIVEKFPDVSSVTAWKDIVAKGCLVQFTGWKKDVDS